ncbi:MAG: outer membrane beta-barrel protein [Rhodospirillaceae bacterium]|nr:outer membrane beta-barrel protein [Rhodospirillaceae bacterium]
MERPPGYVALPKPGVILGVVAGLTSLCFCSASEAQEWKLDTGLTQQVLYGDNLLLGRESEISDFASVTTPALRLQRTSPTFDFSLDGQFEFSEYLDHTDFNSQDQSLRLKTSKALTDRSSLGVSGSFIRDTNLTSDMDETGKFVDEPVHYTSWDVHPSWTYLLSPVDQVVLGGLYRSVTYDGSEKTDYRYFGSTVDYGHKLSEVDRLTANFSYFHFDPDSTNDQASDTLSALAGYAYAPSERLAVSGSVGLGYSLEDQGATDTNNDGGLGYRLKFNAKYQLADQTALKMSLSHDAEPSSDGEQVTRNRATFGLNHQLTPYTAFALDVDYVDNYDYAGLESDTRSDNSESRYASVRPSPSWLLTEELSLIAEYRYRYKLYEDGGDAATSNTVFLSVKYALPTWGWDGF